MSTAAKAALALALIRPRELRWSYCQTHACCLCRRKTTEYERLLLHSRQDLAASRGIPIPDWDSVSLSVCAEDNNCFSYWQRARPQIRRPLGARLAACNMHPNGNATTNDTHGALHPLSLFTRGTAPRAAAQPSAQLGLSGSAVACRPRSYEITTPPSIEYPPAPSAAPPARAHSGSAAPCDSQYATALWLVQRVAFYVVRTSLRARIEDRPTVAPS